MWKRSGAGLRDGGLAGGRRAVSMIVGRDPEALDEAGVSRAAIESLAENFSDGIVAPAFWYAVFGLPGLMAYKMLNTADSMIGHLNDRHRDFGRAAATLDDFANWPAHGFPHC
jgi:adenosylcobinamide-phosphate synthase